MSFVQCNISIQPKVKYNYTLVTVTDEFNCRWCNWSLMTYLHTYNHW